MKSQKRCPSIRDWWYWMVGPAALLWIVLRSGTNPKRLTYPCQQAALPLAVNWMVAIIAFFTGSLLIRKWTKISAVVMLIGAVVWLTGTVPDWILSEEKEISSLPIWDVADPISRVFVMDSLPPTTGSLAAGNASVPDEYLSDPAIDTLMTILEAGGVFLHQTESHPDGIVGADNVVIIKGNFQWTSRNTTNTDRIKGLLWHILNHPDGFSGEILICDNTQDIGTGIDHRDNNSEDPDQSILDMVGTFFDKGYSVSYLDWNSIWAAVADEYSAGDYTDGYVYETDTKISYPKFRTPSGNHYVSLRYGIWDSLSAAYDSARLCIIDVPVLKAHWRAGATVAVKNWIGVLTTAHRDERYGGMDPMHDTYFFGPYALVARVMAVTFPRLTLVDAAWTTTDGPVNLSAVANTKMLVASTDPVAASWYAAKFILTPVAVEPGGTDPDRPTGSYNVKLNRWRSFLADSAGFPCTNDSTLISVCDRTTLAEPYIWLDEYSLDDSQGNNNGRPDEGETANLVMTLINTHLDATGVSATLTNDDPEVHITEGYADFGDVMEGDSAVNETAPFSFTMSPHVVAHMSTFHLHITADSGYTKTISFELLVGTPTILLVDDDAGSSIEQTYVEGLSAKQIHPEAWSVVSEGIPAPADLQGYEAVIWLTGDDRDSTFTSGEQVVISSFLDEGGRLCIAGQNIGFDLVEDGSASDATFYAQYFHAEYLRDTSNETFLSGIGGDPISGEFTFLPIGVPQVSPDGIAPLADASPVFLYQISREAAAIKYEGDHKMVYFACGLEGIGALIGSDDEVRGTLMENVIQWLTFTPAVGDVNQDGTIDILDVLMAVNIILKVVEPTPSQELAADCNGDGIVNVLDVVGIVNVVLGTGTCPPTGAVNISPPVIEYLQSLQSYLSVDNFSTLMGMVSEVRVPEEYSLSRNYPNPFNPVTAIEYTIPEATQVKVEIFNVLGQVVDVLVDSEQEAGNYTILWDATGMSSGVYFYRLRAGDFSATQKMVLMK